MVAVCLFTGYMNVAAYAEATTQSVQLQAKPFALLFLIVSGLLLPYSTVTREPFRLLSFDPVLSSTPWYPLIALALGAIAGALPVRNCLGSMKVAAVGFLVLLLLWIPSATMTARYLCQGSSAAIVFMDAIISEFVLNRPLDLITALFAPIATAGFAGGAASLNYREFTWRMLSRLRRVFGLYDVK